MPESKGVELRSSVAHPIPHHLRFERPPGVEPAGLMVLETGESVEVRTKYYDYVVVSIELELPFEGDCESMALEFYRWINAAAFDNHARDLLTIDCNRIHSNLL